jgi:hypothetical protein
MVAAGRGRSRGQRGLFEGGLIPKNPLTGSRGSLWGGSIPCH